MFSRQWFWKYGYLLIVPVGLLFFWFLGSADRTNQENVNPEVFVEFKKIEANCHAEDFSQQSSQCTAIYKFKKECKQVTRKCNSLTYYEFLASKGFVLPPYYPANYTPID